MAFEIILPLVLPLLRGNADSTLSVSKLKFWFVTVQRIARKIREDRGAEKVGVLCASKGVGFSVCIGHDNTLCLRTDYARSQKSERNRSTSNY